MTKLQHKLYIRFRLLFDWKMVSKKERREIAFIIGAVLVVAMVGFGLQNLASKEIANTAGMAVSLDSGAPTYTGMLYLFEEACFQVDYDSSSTCDELCQEQSATCIPLEDNCDSISTYTCHCCEDLSE